MDEKKHSRRAILGGLAVGASGIGAVAIAALQRQLVPLTPLTDGSWWPRHDVALASAGMSEWSDRIGQTFEIAGEEGKAAFRLTEVRAMLSEGERPESVSRAQAFLAVFEGDRQLAGNAIYKATHPTGSFDIFFGAAPERCAGAAAAGDFQLK